MSSFEEYEKAVRSGKWAPTPKEHEPYVHPESEFATPPLPPKEKTKWERPSILSLILFCMALLFMAFAIFLVYKKDPKAYLQNLYQQTITEEVEPEYMSDQRNALAKLEAWERVMDKIIDEHYQAMRDGYKRKLCITTGDASNCHKAFNEVQSSLR